MIYYCKDCNSYYDKPAHFTEDRCPYGEKSNSSWLEHLEGCPNCHGGLKVVYLCPRCEQYCDRIEFYPFVNDYLCDNCYEEIMNFEEEGEDKNENGRK